MKKVLLSFALAAFAFGAKAQCGTVGLATDGNGHYIGFSQTFDSEAGFYVDSNKAGIFPWGDTLQGGPNDDNLNFYGPIVKPGEAGYTQGFLSYRISQYTGEFVPVGISFGTTGANNTGTTHVLDLSGSADKSFSVKVANLSSDVVRFRVTLQDSLGNTIDTYAEAANHPLTEAYQHSIQDTLDPVDNVSQAVVFLGTFEGAYKTNYQYAFHPDSSDADNHMTGGHCPDNPATLDNTTFHWDAVSGMMFTVVNDAGDVPSGWGGTRCYYQAALNDALISIDAVSLGACPKPAGITKAHNVLRNLNIVPNPATSIATVNYETAASNVVVKVSSLAGAVVKTVNGSSTSASFNVADLAHGLYIVTVEVDGSPVSMKKLMVK